MVSDKTIKFTYSDPKDYKGPIVEGWPPNKNRSIEIYMTGTFQNYRLVCLKSISDYVIIFQYIFLNIIDFSNYRNIWSTTRPKYANN